jgi:site-specific recombinase XerD
MKIDEDINHMLTDIVKSHHTIDEAILRFLESLPGYEYRFHRPLTIKSYERCLLRDPNNFNDYMKGNGIVQIDAVRRDNLEFYKARILNVVEPRTASKFITAVKQLFKYSSKLGWIDENITLDFELPKAPQKKEIEVIKPELCEALLNGDWGCNPFARKRNHLILCFFLRRGMHPKEIPGVMLVHIEPYKDVAVISVCGKRSKWREVMLDPYTWHALQDYAPERGKYLAWRGVSDEHLILGSLPRPDGSYAMSIAGVSGVIKRMKTLLERRGCLLSLKNVCPNLMRHTAESNDWERAEHLPVHHPELSIPNQYGNSLPVALKHYIRHSRRNAYLLLKGGSIIDDLKKGSASAENDLTRLKSQFPETNGFPMYDAGL